MELRDIGFETVIGCYYIFSDKIHIEHSFYELSPGIYVDVLVNYILLEFLLEWVL